MGNAYYTQEDVHMRLHNSICKYKGEPVFIFVNLRDPVNTIYLSTLQGAKEVMRNLKIMTTDPDFVHRSLELGYVNYGQGGYRPGNAYYYARIPQRRQIQGISANNVTVLDAHGPSFGEIMGSTYVRNMLTNSYPTYADAIKQVEEGDVKGVAFHRHACVRRVDGHNISLFFKERGVALWNPKHRIFMIHPGNRDGSYLSAFFHKLGVPV